MWHSLYNKTDWEASEESVQNSQKDGQQGTAILQVHVNTFNPCAEDGNGTRNCRHLVCMSTNAITIELNVSFSDTTSKTFPLPNDP